MSPDKRSFRVTEFGYSNKSLVRLAELELEYGIEKSKVDSIRSLLFAALRVFYQERDRLRLLVQLRKVFIAC